MKAWNFLLEIISLQTARGRLIFAAAAHIFLLSASYSWLSSFSLYKLLGLTQAPSIGLTRAYWKLLQGDLIGAWMQNWLIFPVITVGWSIVALDLYQLLKSGSRPSKSLPYRDR